MPIGSLPRGFRQRLIRREVVRLAVSDRHRLAASDQVELSPLKDERFEVFPRQASPSYYDVVVGACRVAGFEPSLEEHSAGSTVWCHDIARGRGVGLMVGSLGSSTPPGSVCQPGSPTANAGHQRGLVRRRRAARGHPLARRRCVAGSRSRLAIGPASQSIGVDRQPQTLGDHLGPRLALHGFRRGDATQAGGDPMTERPRTGTSAPEAPERGPEHRRVEMFIGKWINENRLQSRTPSIEGTTRWHRLI
jgi:hypothetical protein